MAQRLPSYIVRMRQSYALQRSVPRDLQKVLGKRLFKEPGGATLSEARARVPAFLARTDAEIKGARGGHLTPQEQLIQTGPVPGYSPQVLVEEMFQTVSHYKDDGTPNPEFENLMALASAVQDGKAGQMLTTQALLYARRQDRQPAGRTYEGWDKALKNFMAFTEKEMPFQCTRADAVAYKDHLVGRTSRATAKTQLAYLSGLWTTLVEKQGDTQEHIFKGLPGTLDETTKEKALKAAQAKRNRSFEPPIPITEWRDSKYTDVFKLLYFTGARLAEIAALRVEDIHEDHISVEWQDERSLKTANSVRDIPLHPSLTELVSHLKVQVSEGHLWPQLKSVKEIDGSEVIRWGHNLSKPCRSITGNKPKDFRDRFADQLRGHDFNQVNIQRLMGHSANDTNSSYGGLNWDKYQQMIHAIT